jgi:copper resistance protein B
VDSFPWGVSPGTRSGSNPTRAWAALGLAGVAPGWFDVEATFYVGDAGRTALRLKSTYDMLLTQRLILQPQIEANLESRADPARLVGAGLTDLRAGLRLRYEIRRELAPYIGLAGTWRIGGTADRARAAGYAADERGLVLGVWAWF